MSASNPQASCSVEITADGRASLAGPLTIESVAAVFRRMERRGAEETPLRKVDLAGVTSADSAGLALLLEWQARARAAGGKLSVENVPNGLLRLARLCEAVDLLDLADRGGERTDAS